ncbi:hypothetical protein B7494_g2412 [Chlorociboria aeruginascens]|nr:hypothetical protein B7494_g2412 [Chlorociboria aeruginascens]
MEEGSKTNALLAASPEVDHMLRIKIGQLFIVGFHGLTPSEDIKTLIQVHKVGAIILFQRNVSSASQLRDLTSSLQALAKEAGYTQDLFIAIDQENGLVTRIKPPIATQLPGSMALGATGDTSDAFNIAAATAETLSSFGINMTYSPVADINSEPKNPVIGVRSPSDDPEMVGRFVSAQIKALQSGGIVSCVKHFPGHGDTAVDSHYGLPVISKNKAKLENCEFVPFRRAVAEGVESVMTAHIAMPGLLDLDNKSSGLPASLNPNVIKILREEMKFPGVIISDCLEMDGVRATYGTENGAVMALKVDSAGSDCVCICHTMSVQIGAIQKVTEAVRNGNISRGSIEASYNRVVALKERYATHLKPGYISTLANSKIRNARQTELASAVYCKSTTVVRKAPGIFPISTDPSTNIVYLSPGKVALGSGVVDSGAEKTREPYTPSSYIDILRHINPNIIDMRYYDGTPLSPESEKAVTEADVVILATRNGSLSPYQKEMGIYLGNKIGDRLIAIATCDPYDFLEESDIIKNYITIYEPTIPAFKSAVDIVFGITQAKGKLPVASPKLSVNIRPFNNSEEDVTKVWMLWQEILPNWPVKHDLLKHILLDPTGAHLIHEHGFCVSFLAEGHGKIACIGVLEAYRGKGYGTALIRRAQQELRIKAQGYGLKDAKSFTIGSVFPRLWPGVPVSLPAKDKDFFLHRGFRKPMKPTSRDLFRSIKADVAPPHILERVAKVPLTFAPWTPEGYEECMTKQRANFSHNEPWIQAYEDLAAANQHHEVMVAHSPTGKQIGWTLMCSASSIRKGFAFLPLTPSGEKTGLIACVGVDRNARGNGAGLALLVKAMENMRDRGMDGVLIDWVVIRGFYENLGRLTSRLREQIMVKITAWISAATFMAFVFMWAFECPRINMHWNFSVKDVPACSIGTPASVFASSANVVTDFMIMAIPLRVIWKAQLSLRRKIELLLLFCTGLFVIFVSFFRAILLITAWSQKNLFILSETIVANAPILHGLYKHGKSTFRQQRPSSFPLPNHPPEIKKPNRLELGVLNRRNSWHPLSSTTSFPLQPNPELRHSASHKQLHLEQKIGGPDPLTTITRTVEVVMTTEDASAIDNEVADTLTNDTWDGNVKGRGSVTTVITAGDGRKDEKEGKLKGGKGSWGGRIWGVTKGPGAGS